jgi:hypothetical protein
MRFILILGAVVAVSLLASGCDGGGGIKSAEDAGRYIDEIARGTKPATAKLAPDATAVARAAVADTEAVDRWHELVQEAPDKACEIAELIDKGIEADPNSDAPTYIGPLDKIVIEHKADQAGLSRDTTDRAIDDAQHMSQFTWVKAVAAACEAAKQF